MSLLRVLHSPPARRLFSSSTAVLAGHNKWSKIKDKKGVNDAAKAATLTKARRDIIMAVRSGGGSTDPDKNLALDVVLRRLKHADIPKDNITRALNSAAKNDVKMGETVTYEAMAFGSVGIIVECISNNPTRTVQDLKAIFSRNQTRIAPVRFMFERFGIVSISLGNSPSLEAKEAVLDIALSNEAIDFEESTTEEGTTEIEFYCPPDELFKLTQAVSGSGEVSGSELGYKPNEKTEPSEEQVAQMNELMAALEENEDVSRVWTTID